MMWVGRCTFMGCNNSVIHTSLGLCSYHTLEFQELRRDAGLDIYAYREGYFAVKDKSPEKGVDPVPPPLQQVYAEMAYELLAETELKDVPGLDLPPSSRVIVSYGWDGSGNRGTCRVGAGDIEGKDAAIFIRPEEWNSAETMLTVLFHEMVHAGLPLDPDDPNDPNKNHEGDFERICTQAGLLDKGHAPSEPFLERMRELATQLPPFPAAPLEGQGPEIGVVIRGGSGAGKPGPTKSKNRNRRWVCDCGVIVRVAREDFRAECMDCGTKFKHRPAPSEKKRN